jgi:hypothetical protein
MSGDILSLGGKAMALQLAVVTISVFVLTHAASQAQVESLRSIALRTGGVAVTHVNIDGPQWPLDKMARTAEVIIRGRITEAAARLNDDESLVFTDYTVQPLEILKSSAALVTAPKVGPTKPIVFQQLGGTVRVDGLVLRTTTDIEDSDKPIKLGAEYFLFLRSAISSPSHRARPGVYESVTGPLGIFPIRDGKVENLTRHAAGVRAITDQDPATFGAMIRALATEKN